MPANTVINPQPLDRQHLRESQPAPTRTGKRFGFERTRVDNSLSRGEHSTDEWNRDRTIAELKTIIQAIQMGVTDEWQLTDLIFYSRHPELKGRALPADNPQLLEEWNSISSLLVHSTLNEIKDVAGVIKNSEISVNQKAGIQSEYRAAGVNINSGTLSTYTTKYDSIIENAVEWCPGLKPSILKSLLAQESAFRPGVINKYGYAGIAQFGRPAAREVGLRVGVAGSASDERLDPRKAIPGAAKLLKLKAQRLAATAFAKYGNPNGVEYWKFVTAAYNGGEGTVAVAMGHAYRNGLANARAKGLSGSAAISYARNYASVWDNLKIGGMNSPLGLAARRYFPTIAAQKYAEIGNYPTMIVQRARV